MTAEAFESTIRRLLRQEPFQPDKHCADELCNVLCIPSRLCQAWRHGREFQPLDPVSGHAVLSAEAYQVIPEIRGGKPMHWGLRKPARSSFPAADPPQPCQSS